MTLKKKYGTLKEICESLVEYPDQVPGLMKEIREVFKKETGRKKKLLEPVAEEVYELEKKTLEKDEAIQAFGDSKIIEGNPFQTIESMNRTIEALEKKYGKFSQPKWFIGSPRPRDLTFIGYVIKRPKPLDKKP